MELLKEQEIDLRDYLRILAKRKWIIITCFSIAALIGSIRAFTAIPVYLAKAQMVIERENPNLVSIQEVMSVDSAGSDYYQTQYKIIASRSVARDVITRMGLENSQEFFPKPKNDILTKLRRQVILTLSSWKKKVLSLLNAGEPASHNASERKKAVPSGIPGDTNSDSPSPGLVSALVGRIQVEPIPNSRLVNVGVFAKDRVLAASMANEVVQAYIDQNLETKLSAAKDAVKWLGDRIEEERKKVEEAESALLNYKEAHQIITDFSSDAENITAEKLAQLNSQVVDAESRRVEAETRYRQALAVENSPEMLDSIPEVLSNSLIQEIKRMEVGLYNRVSELSKKYGPKHPQMVAIYSELEALKERKIKEARRVVASLRSEYKLALARESALKKALAKQKGESLSMNKKAIQYGVLRRQAESSKHMYELLFKRFKETSLTEEMKTGNIRVIDRAEVPMVPVSPNKKRMVLISMILGIALGIGFAFVLEYLDNTIRFPEEIRDYLGIPYMGPVPAFDTDEVLDGMPVELIALHSPKAAASESFRGIRTSILFSSA